MSKNKRLRTLVLDLDETLVHTFDDLKDQKILGLLSDPHKVGIRDQFYVLDFYNDAERRQEHYWGIRRPHLDVFLKEARERVDLIVIWTAGSHSYARSVIDAIFVQRGHQMPDFLFSKLDCLKFRDKTTKPLELLLKMDKELAALTTLSDMLMIDDLEDNNKFNGRQGLHVPSYEPNPTVEEVTKPDDVLLQVLKFVQSRYPPRS